MKILHLCLDAPFNDDWGYQDNLLPKYQKKLGHSVTIITTNTIQENGIIKKVDCARYFLNNGIEIIRLDYKTVGFYPFKKLKKKFDIYPLIIELKPDYIFSHGLLNYSFYQVIRYKKKVHDCILIQDNHLDENIGFKVHNIKDFVIRGYYRHLNRYTQKYVTKVYGVTPWRKTYAEKYFKISPQKTDVLIMGADDENIDFENKIKIKNTIREQYGVTQNDFLIVTGGKIDQKKNIDLLIDACGNQNNVKLLIFGSIIDEMKTDFSKKINKYSNIIYVGWFNSEKVYDYFFSADLVFFPGQHSVLWEQACASKVPCVFKRWKGMTHVNNGGNADFLNDISIQSITDKIQELRFTDKYFHMKEIANSSATDVYLYSNIARKSLECVEWNEKKYFE